MAGKRLNFKTLAEAERAGLRISALGNGVASPPRVRVGPTPKGMAVRTAGRMTNVGLRTARLTQEICFVVPGRPRGKASPRSDSRAPDKAHFLEKPTRDYMKAVSSNARLAMMAKPVHDGPFRFSIVAFYNPPKSWPAAMREAALKGEIAVMTGSEPDNLNKGALDAVRGIVVTDDAFCMKSDQEKIWGEEERMEIRITPIAKPTPKEWVEAMRQRRLAAAILAAAPETKDARLDRSAAT